MNPSDTLSPREREVCDLLTDGASNHRIATTLFITENTVEFHLRNIFRKLNVCNRTQAAMRCIKMAAFRTLTPSVIHSR
jgi:LuxR family maltose regulon positive regulatory protein